MTTNISGVQAAADVASVAGGWAPGAAGTCNIMRLTYSAQAAENLQSHMANVTNGRAVHPRMLAVRHAVAAGVSSVGDDDSVALVGPDVDSSACGACEDSNPPNATAVPGVYVVAVIQAVLSHPLLVDAVWHSPFSPPKKLAVCCCTLAPGGVF